MSISILIELQHEVRRLFIAGSGMAAGDLRLTKLLPQLQKLGESAPVFNRIAQAVSQVLEAETSGSAIKLLELGMLLNSVLYTQGITETKEDLVTIEGTETELSTSIPYRKLYPLIEALTQKGQGRMEQLRQGYEDRLFMDLRVVPAAVAALDDSYVEIPEFLQKKVLPEYGLEALPVLQRQFKLDGGKGDSRRLELIHDLLSSSSLGLLLQAARDGSTEVRSTATELLGYYPEHEDFILEQADDKKKEIRRAAFFALSRLGTAPAIERLYKAFNSKDRDIAIEPIQLCKANELTLSVIENAESALERILQRTQALEAAEQLMAAFRSLEGKRVPEVASFLIKLLSTPGFIVPETEVAQEAAVELLLELDLPEADQFAVSLHEAYNRRFIANSFRAAVKILSPDDVYERFCHEFKSKKQQTARQLLRVMEDLTVPWAVRVQDRSQASEEIEWDPRWVQLCIRIDEEELVCRLARERDPKVIEYLIHKCEKATRFNRDHTVSMLLTLFSMRAPDAPKLLMDVLERGGTKQFYYLDYAERALIQLLPSSYADRLRQFAETFSYASMKEQLLEIADSIAAKPELTEQTEHEEKGQGLWGWIKNKMS